MGYLRRGKWIRHDKFVSAGVRVPFFSPFFHFFIFPPSSHKVRPVHLQSWRKIIVVLDTLLQVFQVFHVGTPLQAPSGVNTRGSYTCTKSATLPALLLHARDLDQSFGSKKACQQQVNMSAASKACQLVAYFELLSSPILDDFYCWCRRSSSEEASQKGDTQPLVDKRERD
jgi:hypothetical protein